MGIDFFASDFNTFDKRHLLWAHPPDRFAFKTISIVAKFGLQALILVKNERGALEKWWPLIKREKFKVVQFCFKASKSHFLHIGKPARANANYQILVSQAAQKGSKRKAPADH